MDININDWVYCLIKNFKFDPTKIKFDVKLYPSNIKINVVAKIFVQ